MEFIDQQHDDDCLVACLATVLYIPYDSVPTKLRANVAREHQHNWMQQFLRTRNLVAWTFGIWGEKEPLLMFGNQEVEYHLWPTGLWLASVKSPRNDDDHVVVMKGANLIHDPHPKRYMGHKGFTQAIVLMPW